jgi:3',5'-cyclic-AMP phosphodiesterase
VLIAQLSDTHICRRGHLYKGVSDSNRKFCDAIEHLHELDRRPDLVLLTGDLVDEGHPDEYAMALELLSELGIPYLVIPGNHDNREELRAAFSSHSYLPRHGPLHYCINDHAIRIVALDTCTPGVHHGELDSLGLEWLKNILSENTLTPTLLIMHHPPFVSGIPYLDKYRYLKDDGLGAVLRSFSNIEAVLCGHVHRAIVRRWAGTIVVACPSTTTEIALQLRTESEPRSYLGPPACMLHLWSPPNGLVSHISFIGNYPGPYPFF